MPRPALHICAHEAGHAVIRHELAQQTRPDLYEHFRLIKVWARGEDRVEDREKSIIARVLSQRFGFEPDQVAHLIKVAGEGAI
jgi:hypothetical protein